MNSVIGIIGFFAVLIAIAALVMGHFRWLGIQNRVAAVLLLFVGLVLMLVGGLMGATFSTES